MSRRSVSRAVPQGARQRAATRPRHVPNPPRLHLGGAATLRLPVPRARPEPTDHCTRPRDDPGERLRRGRVTNASATMRWVPLAVAARWSSRPPPRDCQGSLCDVGTAALCRTLLLHGRARPCRRLSRSSSIWRWWAPSAASSPFLLRCSLGDRLLSGFIAGLVVFAVVLPISTALVVAAPYARGPNDGRHGSSRWASWWSLRAFCHRTRHLGPSDRHLRVPAPGSRRSCTGRTPTPRCSPNIYTPQEKSGVLRVGAVVGDHLADGFPYLPARCSKPSGLLCWVTCGSREFSSSAYWLCSWFSRPATFGAASSRRPWSWRRRS